MFDESKCNRCGECFVRCHYVEYDQDRAVKKEIRRLDLRAAYQQPCSSRYS